MMNIFDFEDCLTEKLITEAKLCRSKGGIIGLFEGDEGCYDAMVREDGIQHPIEVTLNENLDIEDSCCTFCGVTLCVHTVAMCLEIQTLLSCIAAEENAQLGCKFV